METKKEGEVADKVSSEVLDAQAREMVKGAAVAGMPIEECKKSLVMAIYREMPPGSPKGPVAKRCRAFIDEVYQEVENAKE